MNTKIFLRTSGTTREELSAAITASLSSFCAMDDGADEDNWAGDFNQSLLACVLGRSGDGTIFDVLWRPSSIDTLEVGKGEVKFVLRCGGSITFRHVQAANYWRNGDNEDWSLLIDLGLTDPEDDTRRLILEANPEIKWQDE